MSNPDRVYLSGFIYNSDPSLCADEASSSGEEGLGGQESSSEADLGDNDDEFNLEDESEDGEQPKQAASSERDDDLSDELEKEDAQAFQSQEGDEAGSDLEDISERENRGEASTSGQEADKGLAAAFEEILAHPGPANVKNKAPILLVSCLSQKICSMVKVSD